MEEFLITVIIADRPYQLTIKRDEEEVIRKSANLINKMIKKYSINYSFKDKQDLLAMAALQYTTSTLKYESQISYKDKQMINKLTEIDKVLTDNL